MIVHSLDTLPPVQQSVYVVAGSSGAAMPPARRPVQAASLAPVALNAAEPVAPAAALHLPTGRHGGPRTLPPMLYLSFAALALLLCARSYTAAGSARH